MNKSDIRITNFMVVMVAASISMLAYIAASYFTLGIGFPLDDAWIHQTYARNLAWNGEWAYIPNQPSAGSTSPLWSSLLSLGYLLKLAPLAWSCILGLLILWGIGWLGWYIFQKIVPSRSGWGMWVGILLVFEWHLVWAALSGMETALFSALGLLVLAWLIVGWKRLFWLGVVVGITVWLRPDGFTLLAPVLLALVLENSNWKNKFTDGLIFLSGVILLLIPYLSMNFTLSGSIWPNTFYAKQAEYAIELTHPLWWRLSEQFQLPLVGVGVILLPGFLRFVWSALKDRKWALVIGATWAVGYLVAYALRLPVTYQHGRYAMPMMPAYFIFSFSGVAAWVRVDSPLFLRRVASRSILVAGGLVLATFWLLGARAYARDVAVIESEMVATAKWVSANTEDDSLVAAHDIGALGFYGNRDLLDLAGLVSPTVIPIIRDEASLGELLDNQEVDYLVTFPGWYPTLVKNAEPVYQTGAEFAPDMGAENMVVYRWQRLTGK